MINEKNIRERLDRRLSGLAASEERRARIRTAIREESEELQPMKRKTFTALVLALVAVATLTAAAVAEHFDLFHFFGAKDERYAAVAPYAVVNMTETALVEHPHLGEVRAAIDSAYFDGLSLTLAYRIDHQRLVEAYTPTEDELARMQSMEAEPVEVSGSESEQAVLAAYNEAIANQTAYGYRMYAVYPGDQTTTDDGVDIPMESAMDDYDADGAYCAICEYETPLPEEIRERDELHAVIELYQDELLVWFDGVQCHMLRESSAVGQMEAVIPANRDAVQRMQGSGKINGVQCSASGEVSKMAATLTFSSDAPLAEMLETAPAGTEAQDCWAEMVLVDENGGRLHPQGGFAPDESTAVTMNFTGNGTLPETLKLYIYTMWEGRETPELQTMDCITLNCVR